MTVEERDVLVQRIVDRRPYLHGFVRDATSDMSAGSWDLVSFSFQCGFETMWDAAHADSRGLLTRPLLSIWRQSVELAIKSAIYEIAGTIEGKSGHNLQKLFQQLITISSSFGCKHDDDLTHDVKMMIELVQSVDPFADRFRYPSDNKGRAYEGTNVDLDKLFQAHWLVVTFCEGTVVELREDFGIGQP